MLRQLLLVRSFSSAFRKGVPWKEALELKKADLYEPELEESFVKGSGKGGQKINKVRNCVLLHHVPTGFAVRCQKTRKLEDNRRIARNLMKSKLDDFIHGGNSIRNLKIAKLQKQKANRKRRTTKKYTESTPSEEGLPVVEEDDDDEEEQDENNIV